MKIMLNIEQNVLLFCVNILFCVKFFMSIPSIFYFLCVYTPELINSII